MTWDPVANPDDYATVDGVIAPGVCTLTKFTRKRRLLKVEPYGARGARVISLGAHLAEFTFSIALSSASEWAESAPFRKAIARVPIAAKGKALSIKWAPLEAEGIKAFLVEQIDGPIPDSDTGLWRIDVTCCEWVPIPKLALASPKEAEKPAAPTDPVEQRIAALSEQFKKRLND